jgi:hypothetical protein
VWQPFIEVIHEGEIVQINIKKDKFWEYICANFVHMVESAFMSIKVCDGKQPGMGKVWLFMKILEQHVLLSRDPIFELPSSLVKCEQISILPKVDDVNKGKNILGWYH